MSCYIKIYMFYYILKECHAFYTNGKHIIGHNNQRVEVSIVEEYVKEWEGFDGERGQTHWKSSS